MAQRRNSPDELPSDIKKALSIIDIIRSMNTAQIGIMVFAMVLSVYGAFEIYDYFDSRYAKLTLIQKALEDVKIQNQQILLLQAQMNGVLDTLPDDVSKKIESRAKVRIGNIGQSLSPSNQIQ